MGKLTNKCVLKHFYRFLKHKNIIEKYFINFTSSHYIAWRESYEQEKAFDKMGGYLYHSHIQISKSF